MSITKNTYFPSVASKTEVHVQCVVLPLISSTGTRSRDLPAKPDNPIPNQESDEVGLEREGARFSSNC
jgi:hypothetical protein